MKAQQAFRNIFCNLTIVGCLLFVPALGYAQALPGASSTNPFPSPFGNTQTPGSTSTNPFPSPFGNTQTSGASSSGTSASSATGGQTCDKSCSSNVCAIGRDVDRWSYFDQKNASKLVTCAKNENVKSTSCLDTIPVKGGNVNLASPVGKRDGPNGNMHYGMDLGTGGQTGLKATAPADGIIKECRYVGGGGRGIFIEHKGNCGSEKYTSVFLHLAAWVDAGGNEYKSNPVGCAGRQVKKGDIVGIVGGSNYKDGRIIENGYAIHLHFELHNNSGSYANPGLKESIINPLCPDIQKLCGGCEYNLGTECGGLSAEAQAELENGAYTAGVGQGGAGAGGGSGGMEVNGAMAKCYLDQYMPDSETCYFCPIFKTIFNAASEIALVSYKTLAKGVSLLVIAAFAIWVSVVVLRHISGWEVKDPRKMLQEIMMQAFRVLVVWLILQVNYFQIIQLTLEPVFNTGLHFAQTITNKSGCPESAGYMQNIKGYETTMTGTSDGGLPKSMGQNITCTIKSIQDTISTIMAYGRQAMCMAWRKPYVWLWVIPKFSLLFTGIMIYISGLVLMVAFPWCLIDAVLSMCIACGLAPAAIGAWAFKITSSYLKKIWDFFMSAMFNFLFLAIIIFIILTVVQQFTGKVSGTLTEDANIYEDPISGLAYWGVMAAQLMIICFLGWVFLEEGKNFAKKFSGAGGVDGIGRSVGGTFAQAANSMGKAGAKIGQKAGKTALGAANRRLGTPIRNKINQSRINRTKNKGEAFYDKDGNLAGYQRTRRSLWTGGREVTSRVTIDKDGTETWSREKRSLATGIKTAALNWTNKRRLAKLQENGTEILDENTHEVIGYTMETSRFGQKVTLTAMKNENGEFEFTKSVTSARMRALAYLTKDGSALNRFAKQNMLVKQKNLNPSAAVTIKSGDKQIGITQKKDKNGVIIEEKIVFKTNIINKLIKADGTINMKVFNDIVNDTTLSKDTVYRAVALEVLKRRGLSMSENFANRNVSFENGVLKIAQENLDGTISNLAMTMGGLNGAQMLIDLKHTDLKGGFIRTVDNGVMKKDISYKAGADVAVATYRFAEVYYNQKSMAQPLNAKGEFASFVNSTAAMYGFNQTDFLDHVNQVKTLKRTYVDINRAGTQPDMETLNPYGGSTAPAPNAKMPNHQEAPQATQPQTRFNTLEDALRGDWVGQDLSVEELNKLEKILFDKNIAYGNSDVEAARGLLHYKQKEMLNQFSKNMPEINSVEELEKYQNFYTNMGATAGHPEFQEKLNAKRDELMMKPADSSSSDTRSNENDESRREDEQRKAEERRNAEENRKDDENRKTEEKRKAREKEARERQERALEELRQRQKEEREERERQAAKEAEEAEQKAQKEAEAAEQKAREEAEAAEQKAREEAEAAERKAQEEAERAAKEAEAAEQKAREEAEISQKASDEAEAAEQKAQEEAEIAQVSSQEAEADRERVEYQSNAEIDELQNELNEQMKSVDDFLASSSEELTPPVDYYQDEISRLTQEEEFARQTAREEDLARQKADDEWQQRKQDAKREEQEAKENRLKEEQARQEAEQRRQEWNEKIERGRERKQQREQNTEGRPTNSIERPDGLQGMSKKRTHRKRGNKS